MKFKAGVDATGMHDMMSYAFHALEAIHSKFGYEATITSGRDGKHKENSLHYSGCAGDVRTRDLPRLFGPEKFAQEIRKRLPSGFDVIIHKTHIHVEYDPKYGEV